MQIMNKLPLVAVLLLSFLLQACINTFNSSSEQGYDSGKDSFIAGDYRQAYEQLKPLAEQGDPDAQYAVGYMYFYGLGTVRDREVAYQWMESAANRGQVQAQQALNELNSGGITIMQAFPNRRSGNFQPQQRSRSNYRSSGSRGSGGGSGSYNSGPTTVNQAIDAPKQAAWPLPKEGGTYTPPASTGSDAPITGPDMSDNADKAQQKLVSVDNVNDEQVAAMAEQAKLAMEQQALLAGQASQQPMQMAEQINDSIQQQAAHMAEPQQQLSSASQSEQMPITHKQNSAIAHSTHSAEPASQATEQHGTSKSYTVQLMGSRDPQDLAAYADKYGLIDQVQMVHTTHYGKDWYILLYGAYSSAHSAQNAINNMPEGARRKNPWVRSIASIDIQNDERQVA